MQTESVTRIFLLSTLLLLPVAAHAQVLGDPRDPAATCRRFHSCRARAVLHCEKIRRPEKLSGRSSCKLSRNEAQVRSLADNPCQVRYGDSSDAV